MNVGTEAEASKTKKRGLSSGGVKETASTHSLIIKMVSECLVDH